MIRAIVAIVLLFRRVELLDQTVREGKALTCADTQHDEADCACEQRTKISVHIVDGLAGSLDRLLDV